MSIYIQNPQMYASSSSMVPSQPVSYAHTAMRNVSPIRSHIPGQSNTPMTYTGPPNAHELNRNRGRRDYSRSSFEMASGDRQQRQQR